jgi:hypothetical protein
LEEELFRFFGKVIDSVDKDFIFFGEGLDGGGVGGIGLEKSFDLGVVGLDGLGLGHGWVI